MSVTMCICVQQVPTWMGQMRRSNFELHDNKVILNLKSVSSHPGDREHPNQLAECKGLQRVVKTAQRIIGTPLSAMEDVQRKRCLR